MNLLYWIVFGLITGVIANYLAPNPQGGIVGSIVLGIFGALVGGYLGEKFFNIKVTGFNITSFFVSVCGSLLILLIARVFMR
jgi:uncharacterized membrane protein YeaQ/YmgE (transglycosylase-associated protein family)